MKKFKAYIESKSFEFQPFWHEIEAPDLENAKDFFNQFVSQHFAKFSQLSQILSDKEKLELALKQLELCHIDAQMALCGDWDRSDDGFKAQIENIGEVFEACGVESPVYKPEIV